MSTTADKAPKIGGEKKLASILATCLPPPTTKPPRRRRARTELERLWDAYHRHPTDEARNRLVETYQPLARDIVRRFSGRLPRVVDRGDLDTAANFGLMSAIAGFDKTRGVRFEAYCELRVRGALLDELRNQDWLPRPWRTRLELQKRARERFTAENDRAPSDAEMAAALAMPLDEYLQVFWTSPLTGARGTTGGSDLEERSAALEIVADPHSDTPGEKLTRDEVFHLVTHKLTEQEYRVVYLKYWEDLSMREIGDLMSLSESRVCKIHGRLLERLKDRLRVNAAE